MGEDKEVFLLAKLPYLPEKIKFLPCGKAIDNLCS
jgi:hypothetical protein